MNSSGLLNSHHSTSKFKIQYHPGKMNPADPLSRTPVCNSTPATCDVIDAETSPPCCSPYLVPEVIRRTPIIIECQTTSSPIDETSDWPQPYDIRRLQLRDETIGPVLKAFPDQPTIPVRSPALKQLVRQYPRLYKYDDGVLRRRSDISRATHQPINLWYPPLSNKRH